MENILLVVLLLVALTMIGLVLMQRNEGGGLGMGGGAGGIGGRPKANPLARLTWILGAAFFALSIALTIINGQGSGGSSVTDLIQSGEDGDSLLPPPSEDESLLPPSGEEGTTSETGASDDTLLPPAPE